MKAKLNSSIPWNNHCMRKYGNSIKKQLSDLGADVSVKMAIYTEQKRTQDVMNEAVWKSDQVGHC